MQASELYKRRENLVLFLIFCFQKYFDSESISLSFMMTLHSQPGQE